MFHYLFKRYYTLNPTVRKHKNILLELNFEKDQKNYKKIIELKRAQREGTKCSMCNSDIMTPNRVNYSPSYVMVK